MCHETYYNRIFQIISEGNNSCLKKYLSSFKEPEEAKKIVERIWDEHEHPTVNDMRNGDTPLFLAIKKGNPEACKILIGFGADVNRVLLARANWTPLHQLVDTSCNIEICRLLMDNGASIEAKDYNGFTPMQKARDEGKESIWKMLKHFHKE